MGVVGVGGGGRLWGRGGGGTFSWCLHRAPINAHVQPLRTRTEKDALNLRPEGPTGRTKKVPGYGGVFSSLDLLFPNDRNGSRELSEPHLLS